MTTREAIRHLRRYAPECGCYHWGPENNPRCHRRIECAREDFMKTLRVLTKPADRPKTTKETKP